MTAPTLERPTVADLSPDRYLTRAEVAALLRVSERTVDRLATGGRITRIRFSTGPKTRAVVRYSEREVRALLAEGGA